MSTKRLLRKRWTEEPGLSIGKKVLEFWLSVLKQDHGRNAEELFGLLEGLTFREEVASGRDLRGRSTGVGSDMDFSNTDFSYARSVGGFYRCDLTNASFNEISAERSSFGSVLKGSSFLLLLGAGFAIEISLSLMSISFSTERFRDFSLCRTFFPAP